MDYQVSARKFRPSTFDQLIGQPHVVRTLRNAILRKHVAHAYLFSGMRGVGKTTVARILAKALNCKNGPTPEPCERCESCEEITRGNSVDVIEIDGASNTGVDDVRELRENVKFSPFRGSYRIYIIDEVHMLSNSAFNALLKTLEEPPPHAVFVFATTEVHKIPATITSRCQHFNFRRIPRQEIMARLQAVVDNMNVTIGKQSVGAIARASEGSMRDALSLLDQAVAFGGTEVKDHDVEDMLGTVPDVLVRRLVDTVVTQDAAAAVALIGEVVDHGYDLRAYCSAVVERMRSLMIGAVVPNVEQAQSLMDLPGEEVKQLLAEAGSFSIESLQDLFNLFAQTEDRLRSTGYPRFVFEVAAVRAARSVTHEVTTPEGEQAPSREQAPSVRMPVEPGFPLKPAGMTGRAQSPSARTPVEPRRPERGEGRLSSKPPDEPIRKPASPSAARSSQGGRQSAPGQREHPVPQNPADAPPTARSGEEEKRIPRTPATPRGNPSPTTLRGSGQTSGEPFEAQGNLRASLRGASGEASPVIGREDWQRVVESVERNHPNVGTFLGTGTLVKIEGQQVIVGFPKKASVACSRIQKEETRALIAKICREVVGATIHLRVVELAEDPGEGSTIKQMRAQRQQRDDDTLLREAREHPLVKHAMDLFGGEVVKASREPEQKEV